MLGSRHGYEARSYCFECFKLSLLFRRRLWSISSVALPLQSTILISFADLSQCKHHIRFRWPVCLPHEGSMLDWQCLSVLCVERSARSDHCDCGYFRLIVVFHGASSQSPCRACARTWTKRLRACYIYFFIECDVAKLSIVCIFCCRIPWLRIHYVRGSTSGCIYGRVRTIQCLALTSPLKIHLEGGFFCSYLCLVFDNGSSDWCPDRWFWLWELGLVYL